VRPALAQVLFQSLHRGTPQRHDALLVALAANLRTSSLQAKVADGKGGDLGDAQTGAVEKLQDGAIAERGGLCLRMRCAHRGALQHLHHFRLSK
jgi:hypothetical protein